MSQICEMRQNLSRHTQNVIWSTRGNVRLEFEVMKITVGLQIIDSPYTNDTLKLPELINKKSELHVK